jgi:hypothetical protein
MYKGNGGIIGFADDGETEKMKGYKVYIKADGSIVYSNDNCLSEMEPATLSSKEEEYFHPLKNDKFDPF